MRDKGDCGGKKGNSLVKDCSLMKEIVRERKIVSERKFVRERKFLEKESLLEKGRRFSSSSPLLYPIGHMSRLLIPIPKSSDPPMETWTLRCVSMVPHNLRANRSFSMALASVMASMKGVISGEGLAMRE